MDILDSQDSLENSNVEPRRSAPEERTASNAAHSGWWTWMWCLSHARMWIVKGIMLSWRQIALIKYNLPLASALPAIISRGFNLDQLGSAVESTWTTYVDVNCGLSALSILIPSTLSLPLQPLEDRKRARRNFSGSSLALQGAPTSLTHVRGSAELLNPGTQKHPNHAVGEEWGKLLLGGGSTVLQRNETADYLRRGLPLSRLFRHISIYIVTSLRYIACLSRGRWSLKIPLPPSTGCLFSLAADPPNSYVRAEIGSREFSMWIFEVREQKSFHFDSHTHTCIHIYNSPLRHIAISLRERFSRVFLPSHAHGMRILVKKSFQELSILILAHNWRKIVPKRLSKYCKIQLLPRAEYIASQTVLLLASRTRIWQRKCRPGDALHCAIS